MKITTTPQREMLDALFGDLNQPLHMLGGRLTVPVIERIRDIVASPDNDVLTAIIKTLVSIEQDPRAPIAHRTIIGGIFSRIAIAHAKNCLPILTKEV